MRTNYFILSLILICAGCTKQNTEISTVLTKEDIMVFDSLFNAWENELFTHSEAYLSASTQAYTQLPAFKELKAMGKKIIPCIIERFEEDSNSFFALPLYNELQDVDSLKSLDKTSEQEKVKEIVRKFRNREREKMWEEANSYKASITDTTFLKTRGEMSYAAIDPLTGQGVNKNYAFNQVVYLKALQRAQKHLSVVKDQLKCDLKSGAEIYISEDLYLFIVNLFEDWNTWLKSGRFEIEKDEQGLYTVSPTNANHPIQSPNNPIEMERSVNYDFDIIHKEKLPENFLGGEVQMQTEKSVYSTNIRYLTVIVNNPTDVPLEFGRDWKVQIQHEGKWIMPKMKKDLCWTDDGLASNETYVRYYFSFPINEFYEVRPGIYRIIKTFFQGNKRFELIAGFEIKG